MRQICFTAKFYPKGSFIDEFTGENNGVECDNVLVAVMQICAESKRDAKMCPETAATGHQTGVAATGHQATLLSLHLELWRAMSY